MRITNDELYVYDLNGQKVNKNKQKPGIYVKDGKKGSFDAKETPSCFDDEEGYE